MDSNIQIWHNNRCGKSREAVKYLESKGLSFTQRLYMQDIPSKEEMKKMLKLLGIGATDWVRKKEKIYTELFAGKNPSEDELLDAMLLHPQLIERPVVIVGKKAIIARPAELIDPILP